MTAGLSAAPPTPRPAVLPRLVTLSGWAVLVAVAVIVIAPGLVATHAPEATDLSATFQPPSAEHLFGTDELGRDVFSRVIYGTRLSLAVAVGATALGVAGGALIGLVAACAGRWVDAVLMRVVDVMLAFPELLLALLVVAVLGGGSMNVAVAIGIAAIPNYARLVRGQAVSVLRSEYVESARVLGVRPWRYLLWHVLPNVSGPVVVLASIGVGGAVIAGAGLSLLGLGARPPEVDWGSMVADGKELLGTAWWISVFPGLMIVIVVVTVTVLGRAWQAAAVR